MSFLKSVEFKVGLLVVMISGIIAVMSMRVSDDPNFLGRKKSAWFYMQDANGLVKNSAIKTAGIPIGTIKDIKLQEGQARVEIEMSPDVDLRVSAVIEIKSQGILGDKFIGLNPGNLTDPPLEDGGRILNVTEKGSLDNLITQVGDVAGSLSATAKVLKESVEGEGTRAHILGRIVSNIERVTEDLSKITGENKEQISEIVDQVNGITKTLNEAINDESEHGFKKTWKNAMVRIDNSLKNIEEITDKVNKGEGTIGKLISDENTAEQVSSAIEGVNQLVGAANTIQTGIDFHGDYLGEAGEFKSNVGIKIQPGLDRYYYIGIVDDPMGVVETTKTKADVTNVGVTETKETKTFYNKTKFTLLYAKNFYNFTLRGGIIENSGGMGVDYTFFRDRFKLSMEAFNFSKVNLRANLQYNFYKGLYVLGGYNDMLNKDDRGSYYLGAGLFLTNDDLKMFASKVPFP